MMRAALALSVATACLLLTSVAGSSVDIDITLDADHWPTEHHDLQNSGRADGLHFNFSGGYNGACLYPLAAASVPTAIFGHSGCTSQDGSRLYIGSSTNSILFIDMTTRKVIYDLALPHGQAQGIAAAPAVYYHKTEAQELLFVGSTNGWMLALRPDSCYNQGPEIELGSPEDECLVWSANLEGNILSGPRLSDAGVDPIDLKDGLLFTGTTSNATNSDGALIALNATDGSQHWIREFKDLNGKSYGNLYEPAIDEVRKLMYVAYGEYVFALNPVTGGGITEFKGDSTDTFVSSVVLTSAGDALYVQSLSGTLWRIDITGTGAADLELTGGYACHYAPPLSTSCEFWNVTVIPTGEEHPSPAPPEFRQPLEIPVGANVKQFLPYSTPSLSPIAEDVIYGLYGQQSGGLVIIDDLTGDLMYYFNGTEGIPFGLSKSSAAVDNQGDIVIASDSPDGVGSQFTRPLLWGLDTLNDKVKFVVPIGQDGELVDSASAILSTTSLGEHVAIMGIDSEVYMVERGYSCPSKHPLAACSGNGVCDCTTGVCACDGCYDGDDCGTPIDCGKHSTGCARGMCECDGCWGGHLCSEPKDCGPHSSSCANGECVCDECWSGEDCMTELKCGDHSSGCKEGKCVCDDCWEGTTCDEPLSCGAHSTGCDQGVCVCENCYYGDTCDQHNDCSGSGTCNADTGECKCTDCKTGTDCSATLDCENGGTCNPTTSLCKCTGNWGGDTCDTCDVCYTGDTCDTVCSGHGICGLSGCDCLEGFGGDKCEQECGVCLTGPKCQTVVHCNGHGVCDATGSGDGCECDHGWKGTYCDFKDHSSGSNGGAIAGGIIGGLACAGLAFVAFKFRAPIGDFVREHIPSSSGGGSSGGYAPATSSSAFSSGAATTGGASTSYGAL